MVVTELRGLGDRKVLITGAAKGQGFSHAKAFAAAGCDVALLDVTHPIDDDLYAVATPDMLQAAVVTVESLGRRAVPLACDVRNEDEVGDAVGKALAEFGGRIDILVNNAGIAALDGIETMRTNVLDAIIDINLKGTMLVTKHAVGNMIERRAGKIINISSAVTGSGSSNLSHYVASKYGINGLTAAWANELSEFNINVNAVCPATVRTRCRSGLWHGARLGGVTGHDT